MANRNPTTLDTCLIDSNPPAPVAYNPSEPAEQHELIDNSEVSNPERKAALDEIDSLDAQLLAYFEERVCLDPALSRQLVSFQANKTRAAYRWYKYKEAFSASLVEYLLCKYEMNSGKLLDPFAGSGTALFAASASGINADGIELLSIGQQIVTTKLLLERTFADQDFDTLKQWQSSCPWKDTDAKASLTTLRITNGAYPPQTLDAIERYMVGGKDSCKIHTLSRIHRQKGLSLQIDGVP